MFGRQSPLRDRQEESGPQAEQRLVVILVALQAQPGRRRSPGAVPPSQALCQVRVRAASDRASCLS